MNTYNHIYGLSIGGLHFFTIYVPGVRPNMTYFSLTPDILNGKPINTYTKEPTTKIWLMISLTLMALSKLDVLHLLMWSTKAQVVEGRRQVMCGSAFLTLVY
jgi:nucleoside-diphosphate-sugar epimerase